MSLIWWDALLFGKKCWPLGLSIVANVPKSYTFVCLFIQTCAGFVHACMQPIHKSRCVTISYTPNKHGCIISYLQSQMLLAEEVKPQPRLDQHSAVYSLLTRHAILKFWLVVFDNLQTSYWCSVLLWVVWSEAYLTATSRLLRWEHADKADDMEPVVPHVIHVPHLIPRCLHMHHALTHSCVLLFVSLFVWPFYHLFSVFPLSKRALCVPPSIIYVCMVSGICLHKVCFWRSTHVSATMYAAPHLLWLPCKLPTPNAKTMSHTVKPPPLVARPPD